MCNDLTICRGGGGKLPILILQGVDNVGEVRSLFVGTHCVEEGRGKVWSLEGGRG